MAPKTDTKDKTVEDDVKTANELTTANQNTQVGTALDDDAFFGMDTGMEDITSDDLTLPRYTILQGLSPQVNERKDEYVEGARMGMILNTASNKAMRTQRLVFAAYERRFVEWTPRERPCPFADLPQVTGGGLYRDYGTDGDLAMQGVREWEENASLWTPRGNELVVTGTWYVIDPDTLSTGFIAMGKTQFTSSKKLMAGIRDEKIMTRNHGIQPAPLFYRIWEMGTRLREHDGNEWFVWNHRPNEAIKDHVNGIAILEAVKEMVKTIKSGQQLVDVTVGETEGQGRPSNSDDRAM